MSQPKSYRTMLYHYSVKICLIYLLLFPKVMLASPSVTNLTKRNPHFVGRSDYFEKINQQASGAKLVVLSGYSGMGKSQIAKEYAHLHLDDFDVIWWFRGKQYMEPQIKALAHALNKDLGLKWKSIDVIGQEKLTNILLNAFDSNNLKVLLIFDDFKASKDLGWVLSKSNSVDLIVTTQNSSFSKTNTHVGAFNSEESLEFLSRIFPLETEEGLQELAQHLKKQPLITSPCI